MFQMRLPEIGIVSFHIEDMSHARHATILKVKDEYGIEYTVECLRIIFPADLTTDYGWTKIQGYVSNGHYTKCEKYLTIS